MARSGTPGSWTTFTRSSRWIRRLPGSRRPSAELGHSASNRRFHGVIYAASGNRSLPQLVEVLKARILRLQLRTMLVPGRSDRSLAEHMALYDAIARGDVDGAERAARAHMSGLRETIAGAWNLVRS